MNKNQKPGSIVGKVIIYVALIVFALTIIVPVAWVFMASFKRNSEFIGAGTNPWALPKQLFVQNFQVAFQDAQMGEYLLNTVLVTVLALALILVIALPAAFFFLSMNSVVLAKTNNAIAATNPIAAK